MKMEALLKKLNECVKKYHYFRSYHITFFDDFYTPDGIITLTIDGDSIQESNNPGGIKKISDFIERKANA
jgi:hypothetical protein